MKRILLLFVVLSLTGCPGVVKKDPYQATRKEYIVTPCNTTPIPRPSWSVDALPIGSKIDVQMRALRADRKAALGHITVLETVIDSCRDKSELVPNNKKK